MTINRLLTDGEAAKLLRMPTSRLKRLAKRGNVPAVMLPDDEIRFDETELARWIDGHKRFSDGKSEE